MQTKECNQLFGTSSCGAADAAVGGGLIAPFVGLSGSRGICPTGSDLNVERKFLKDSYCATYITRQDKILLFTIRARYDASTSQRNNTGTYYYSIGYDKK